MPVIDADAHVIETERTWDFMEDSEASLRPAAVINTDPSAPTRVREFWSIDGRLFLRRAFDVERTGTSEETRELRSIEARLRHMDDDLPYVLQYAGEDNLVIGSDYGHADTSSELEPLRHLKQEGKVPPRVVDKILDDNARALYGL